MKWPSTHVRSTVAEDLPLALLVAVLVVVGSGVSLQDDWRVAVLSGKQVLPGTGGMVLLLAGSLPLAFRRLAPIAVFAVCATASLAYQVVYTPEPLPLGALVALYTVAMVRRPLICGLAAATYMLAVTVGALSGWAPLTDDQYYIDLVSVVATVMLGYGVALSHASTTLAEQRTAQLVREHDGRTRAALAQEQARIAREVHDIVAHDLSVMVAQAAAARRVFATRPETAVNSLASIEAVGRDALDGLRRLVNLLRTQHDQTERSPQPSLERLPWLLAQVERAGLPVDLTIRGRPCPLPATLELNAYRIVQEALTNILKHAGPTRATVVLHYGQESLQVEVQDHGRGSAGEPSAGYGLISMQQRATLLGGDLVAGPAEEEGFLVSARLPMAGVTR